MNRKGKRGQMVIVGDNNEVHRLRTKTYILHIAGHARATLHVLLAVRIPLSPVAFQSLLHVAEFI